MDDFTRRELAAIDAMFKKGRYIEEDVARETSILRSRPREESASYRQDMIDAGRGHLLR